MSADHLLLPAFQRFGGVVGESICPTGEDGYPAEPAPGWFLRWMTFTADQDHAVIPTFAALVQAPGIRLFIEAWPPDVGTEARSDRLHLCFTEFNDCEMGSPGRRALVDRVRRWLHARNDAALTALTPSSDA